jgi:hypothetical protein
MTKGRVLVVTRLESGSIIATLTDLALTALPYVTDGVAAVIAVNALADFAKHLKEWFGYAKSHAGKRRLYRKGKKSSGQRSVEAIVKIGASTGSRVLVKHRTERGETLVAELTPTEAVEAAEHASAEKTKAIRQRRSRERAAFSDVESAVERLSGVNKLSPKEAQAVVDVVVAVLRAAGAGHLLEEIASELEERGLESVAGAVRQHIRASRGR